MVEYKLPVFTQKHFNTVAEELKHLVLPRRDKEFIVGLFGEIFAKYNEEFDYNKFKAKCED